MIIDPEAIIKALGEFKPTGGLTLGELIDISHAIGEEITLRKLSEDYVHDIVQFDFCGFRPTGIDSYRGYYDHLALEYENNSKNMNLGEFIKMLEDANGAIFTGYKGGDYKMDCDTPIWVAPYGRTSGTVVTGMSISKWDGVIIHTAHVED